MSEKVLGFKERILDRLAQKKGYSNWSKYELEGWEYHTDFTFDEMFSQVTEAIDFVFDSISKKKKVPVRLASESVDLKWLEKYVKHIRGCFEKNQPSDFEAGEETGRIEGLEVLLAEAKKEAKARK